MSYIENLQKHAGEQVRVEIIFSQALEEDFQQEFKERKIAKHYTKFAGVMGAGYSNPRLGDAVWPQLNMMYIIYCGEEESKEIVKVAEYLREKYIGEGVACFISKSVEV